MLFDSWGLPRPDMKFTVLLKNDERALVKEIKKTESRG